MSIISCLEFHNSLLMDLPAVTLDSFIACSKQDSRDPLLLKAIQWLISEYKSETLPWFSIPDLSCYPSSLSLCPSQLASCGLGEDTPAVGILHWLFPPGTPSPCLSNLQRLPSQGKLNTARCQIPLTLSHVP